MNQPVTPDRSPYHAHIYYEPCSRGAAERLRQRLLISRHADDPQGVLFVGELRDTRTGPHPKPQFEIHFYRDAMPSILPLLQDSGLTVLIHPLTDDDLADHASLAAWIGEPLPLDQTVLDPIGANQGIARFGMSES